MLLGSEGCRVNVNRLWDSRFKLPMETLPRDTGHFCDFLRKHFSAAPWNEVYDLVEYAAPLDQAQLAQCVIVMKVILTRKH